MLQRLDHVNLYTQDLERLASWYEDVLGMTRGARPPFPFDGAWLYVDNFAVVHMTGVDHERNGENPKLEHFALSAKDIGAFLDHLDERSVPYRTAIVPEFGIIQVNINDPDGNHLHIDFAKEERPTLHARKAA